MYVSVYVGYLHNAASNGCGYIRSGGVDDAACALTDYMALMTGCTLHVHPQATIVGYLNVAPLAQLAVQTRFPTVQTLRVSPDAQDLLRWSFRINSLLVEYNPSSYRLEYICQFGYIAQRCDESIVVQ